MVLSCSVVDMPGATSLKKTDFLIPSRNQVLIDPILGVRFYTYLPSSMLEIFFLAWPGTSFFLFVLFYLIWCHNHWVHVHICSGVSEKHHFPDLEQMWSHFECGNCKSFPYDLTPRASVREWKKRRQIQPLEVGILPKQVPRIRTQSAPNLGWVFVHLKGDENLTIKTQHSRTRVCIAIQVLVRMI